MCSFTLVRISFSLREITSKCEDGRRRFQGASHCCVFTVRGQWKAAPAFPGDWMVGGGEASGPMPVSQEA